MPLTDRRYDSSTCRRAINPQLKVANHAKDAVIIEATNRKATALFLVLAADMASFSLEEMRCINRSYERVFLMSRYFSLRHSLGFVTWFTKIEIRCHRAFDQLIELDQYCRPNPL